MSEPERPGFEKIFLSLLIAGIIFSMGGTVVVGSTLAVRSFQAAAAAGSVTSGAPKSCGEAKQRALQGKKDNDGLAKGSISGTAAGKNVLDKCFGAVITPAGKIKRQRGQPLTAADYKCTGRKAQTNVKTNQVTDTSIAFEGAAAGKCIRTVKNEKPKVPKGQEQKPQGKGGQEGQGKGGGEGQGKPEMPQLPQIPPPSPKPPPPPPQDQKKTTKCDAKGNCTECDENGRNCKPTPNGADFSSPAL